VLFTATIGNEDPRLLKTAPDTWGMKRAATGRPTRSGALIVLKSGEAGAHEKFVALTVGGSGALPVDGVEAPAICDRQMRRFVCVSVVSPVSSVGT
jgi:hypothetical protein